MESFKLPFGNKVYQFFCVPCSDVKEKKHAEEEAGKELARREQHRQDQIVKNLQRCSIGSRFAGMNFDDYRPTCQKAAKVKADCQQYVTSFQGNSGNNLMMIGSPGTGKNMLSAIICQEIIKNGFTALHTTAIKLVRKVKESWRNKEESEQAVIDYFVAPDLLVVDEIGVQFGSQTEQLFLTEIINDRYERKRPTVLISNLKLSQLVEVLGERAVDRFYDDGSKMLVFDWDSYRRINKQ